MNNKEFIPVNTPLIGEEEKELVLNCMESSWISSSGNFIDKFENEFSTYIGHSHGICCSNGSAALDIALRALDYPKGSEIITQDFNIVSPLFSIIREGLTPVLIDSEDFDFNIDTNQIENKITSKTRAILVSHMYCFPAEMEKILLLCEKYKLDLIEDAAEMHGQEYRGKKCGAFGLISTFSFYANKNITSGEGGMILTSDFKLAQRCRKLKNLAFEQNGPRFIHHEIGWNYRMTNIQAAIGLAQLRKIDHLLKLRKEIANRYNIAFKNLKKIIIPRPVNHNSENIYWVYPLLFSSKKDKTIAEKLLKDENIDTRPLFHPMHLQPFLQKLNINYLGNQKFINSVRYYESGFYIPNGLGTKKEDYDRVIHTIIEIDNAL